MHKIRPTEELTALHPLAVFKGHTSKGRGSEVRERGRNGNGMGMEVVPQITPL